MAEEFSSFLAEAKKSPIEEKVEAFGDIVEKIMSIVLRIPDLVDQTISGLNDSINQQISGLESRLNTVNMDLNAIKSRGSAPGGAPGAPPPPGGAPGGPPPPGGAPGGPPGGAPGGPPGGPPPPGGGPPGGRPPGGPPPPGGGRPAQPVSLRGAIMGELKQLFAKRNK